MDQLNPSNFFPWRDDRRKISFWFAISFALVFVCWFGALYGGFNLFFRYALFSKNYYLIGRIYYTNNNYVMIAIIPTLAMVLIALISSINRIYSLHRNGSSYVATALGGVPLGETESVLLTDAGKSRENIFRNVVSEMSLAVGVAQPDLYILPKETGINALATGLTPDDSALVITKGALKYLDREELSGLIGHELSHVLNGDTRHNTLMVGWLAGFFSLTKVGYFTLRFSRAIAWIPLGLFLIAVGHLGDLAGKLLQAAFNRARESMADAYSAQFTRSPKSLAKALLKIGGLEIGSEIRGQVNVRLEYRHLFVAEPNQSWFRTHPPLAERIWALWPGWDGAWHDFDQDPIDYLAEDPPRP
jgi:Zn-dependent protease with chaperone function